MPQLPRFRCTRLPGPTTHSLLTLFLAIPLVLVSGLQAQPPGEPPVIQPGRELRASIDVDAPILPVGQRPFALFRVEGLVPGQRYLATASGDAFAPTLSLLYAVAGITETLREGQLIWEESRAELPFVAADLPGAVPLLMVSSWDLSTEDPSGAWPPARFSISLEARGPIPTPPVRDIEIGTPVRARLDLAEGGFSTEWEDDIPAHLWRLSAPAGTMLRIEMDSDDLDAYLEFGVWDGTVFDVLASNDDGGEGTNALLRTVLASSGPHWIRARSFGAWNATGDYVLSVVEEERRAPLRQTLEIGVPATSTLTLDDAILDESGILFQEWTFFGEAGVPLTIRMTSDNLDSYLSLGLEAEDGSFIEIAFNDDDPDFGLDSRLDFTPDVSRTYLIRARTFGPGGLGPYTIVVTPAAQQEG